MKFKDLRVGMIVEQVKFDSDSNTLAKVGVVTGVGYMYDTEILLNASNRRDTDLTKTEVLQKFNKKDARSLAESYELLLK